MVGITPSVLFKGSHESCPGRYERLSYPKLICSTICNHVIYSLMKDSTKTKRCVKLSNYIESIDKFNWILSTG